MVEKYPGFVGRQQQIERLKIVSEATGDRSRAVLLDGHGGIGKTWLLQQIERLLVADGRVLCTKVIDMDDTSYHLPSYFGSMVAEALGAEAFGGYLYALDFYQDEERRKIDFKTMYAHLQKSEYAFIEDYNRLASQKRVTMLIDTFEEVQDTDLWSFFEQLINKLKNTTFIFSGRRVNELKKRLKNSKIAVEVIALAGLAGSEIDEFFAEITTLSDEQKQKLALLTAGNPLLLCLALDCYRHGYWLDKLDNRSLTEIKKLITKSSDSAKQLRYEFEKSLVVAYADTEPFRYFIRQFAHASRRVNKEIFKTLIPFRSEADADLWWEKLQDLPYIRKRASGDYISVHDVLRELLFTYVIPMRDPDYSERKQINQKLISCYDKILAEERRELQKREVEFDDEARQQGGFVEQRKSMGNLTRLVTQKNALERKIWILQAEVLHYQLSADLVSGGQVFIEKFDDASKKRQLSLRQRLTNEIKPLVATGLIRARVHEHFEISCRLAGQEAEAGQAEEAIERVNELLKLYTDPAQKAQLLELRAGCKLGLEHGVAKAIEDYKRALNLAKKIALATVDLARLEKQLGWCYRQLGNWDKAGYWYGQTQKRLARNPSWDPDTTKELASLYNNAAYIEALRGNFAQAMDLGQRGLQHRIALNLKREQGMSYSTLGEICRYNRNFAEALSYYRKAEDIFYELDDRGWLGRLWQQEAICLLQMGGSLHRALDKIKHAIEYCIRHNALALPSAYNRAGRIIAVFPELPPEEQLRQSLYYFRTGVEKALEVGDDWFFMANCIEALEVIKREYELTKHAKLLKHLDEFDERITEKFGKRLIRTTKQKAKIHFPDLFGRREIVLGTIDYLDGLSGKPNKRESALHHYLQGFQLVTRSFFGSYGLLHMTEELDALADRVIKLPPKTALRWRDSFAGAWKGKNINSTLKNFAARVDELLNINKQSPSMEPLKQVA